jgi:hypothetical protein
LEDPSIEKATEVQKTADTESADSNTVEEEYPASIQLVFITTAIIFSIFLASLDQVRAQRPQKQKAIGKKKSNIHLQK